MDRMSLFATDTESLVLSPASAHRYARRLSLFLLSLIPLALSGCRSCDLVEAQLRSRDRELRELREELWRTEAYNGAMQREIAGIRQNAPTRVSPEEASQTYTLKSIQLGRQTGGYDDDEIPGDEALQIQLEPIDPDGHTIKAPGTLYVTAFEVSGEGTKKPLSSWVLAPDELRKRWRSGLLSTGYHIVLPWKNWPTTEKLRVVVQFVLADGRVFEADKDITVKLAPKQYRKCDVPIETWPNPPPPRNAEPLQQGPVLSPSFKTTSGYTPDYRPAVQLMRPIPRASE
jgi:hypothetical protein